MAALQSGQDAESSSIAAAESESVKNAQEAEASSKTAESQAQVAAAESSKQAESSAAQQSQQPELASTDGNDGNQHGNMNTADTGTIVGNANSKIYHTPGQAGYRMNSSNAVHFNTEAEAQAAGYRRALR